MNLLNGSVNINKRLVFWFFLVLNTLLLMDGVLANNYTHIFERVYDTIDKPRINVYEKNDIAYKLELIDNAKGLSNSSVNCIFQDTEGILWIGTWDGLNMYDGSEFKIFRPELDNVNSLSNQVVLSIDEDGLGRIWVLTMHGINCYDKKTDVFRRYYFSRNNKQPLVESEFSMALDKSRNIFCGVKDWGIGYFDDEVFVLLTKQFSKKTVKKMDFADNGELFVLFDDSRLYSFEISIDKENRKVISKTVLISDNIKIFGVCNADRVCIIPNNGRSYLLSVKNKTERIYIDEALQNIVGNVFGDIIVSGNNSSFIIDSLGRIKSNDWLKNINNQKITNIIGGSENIFWAGTDGNGLLKLYPYKKVFNLISKLEVKEMGGIVRSFLETGNNTLFVGTKGNGLFIFSSDLYKSRKSPIKYKTFNEKNSGLNNSVFSLFEGDESLIYIGTDGLGISIFDEKRGRIINWKDIGRSNNYEKFSSVYSIYQDKDGFIWIGTNGYGMIRLKLERFGASFRITDLKRYTADLKQRNSLSSNIIYSIVPKGEEKLWIGTRLGGLNLFDKKSESFVCYKKEDGNRNSLSSDDVLCLAKDDKDRLWVGTSIGLNLLEKINLDGSAVFKRFTTKDGLPNNTIHGIELDNNSNLWISTNLGLSNLVLKGNRFFNYTTEDNLQNNEFSDGASYRSESSGVIFMGGINGFNYFRGEDLKISSEIPKLFVERIGGQNSVTPYCRNLVLKPNSVNHASIVLKHDQNFFDVEMRALTYINADKCDYAYKLSGFDNNWNYINNREVISFTNVPHGEYNLLVKWTNINGVWSDAVTIAEIEIKPIFWQSSFAYLLYLLLTFILIRFGISYYKKRQSLEQNIFFRKKEEELHENRLNFFTNIAHEFQTPLTLIVSPAQKLSEDKEITGFAKKYINMIQRNSHRLLFLTQQLLEFRKADYGYLNVSVKEFDLVDLAEQIAELFDYWALENKIDYTFNVSPKLFGCFDKDKIEKILFNLMSNAFKYTPIGGKIDVDINIIEGQVDRLELVIKNTGKGISKEKMNSLFNPFFLTNIDKPTETYLFRTGMGLAYVEKLVTVLRGEIIVTSVENKDTTFRILIPCSHSSFDEKELDYDENPVLISKYLKNILVEEEDAAKLEHTPSKIEALDTVEDYRKTILIVEDEKEMYEFLKSLLHKKYKIIIASNGLEALDVLNKLSVDIIISDVMMPLMDGVELCRAIKTDNKSKHIPIIMLTAKSSISQKIEGLENGANMYITKPFHTEHLLVVITKLLQEKEQISKYVKHGNIMEELTCGKMEKEEEGFVIKLMDTIRKNIDNENLQSAFLEKELGISSTMLYKDIKKIFGLTPSDLIRTVRLKYAAELLRENKLTVSQVCYLTGFNNRSYFYREFHKIFKTTPKNFQIKNSSSNSKMQTE